MPRLFVAIELPESVKSDLARLQSGVPGARWLEREQMHLTLRFIGAVDRGTFADIAAVLSTVAGEPVTLTLGGLDTFGNRRHAHTLWVGVSKSPALHQLKGRVDSALARADIPGDDRKFAPHITLARLKGSVSPRLGTFIAANNLFRSEPFTVDSFALFSSITRSEGAIYTAEAVYPLRDR